MITLTNGVQVPENAVQLQTTAAIDGYYVTQPLRLVQYDQTLPVAAVQLTYQNQPYTPPTGAELNVRMGKPDGTTVYNPCLGMDSSGIVYFVFTQQMTAAAGDGKLTVEVTDSGVKNSAPIIVNVAENPVQEGSIESTDEFLTLQEILAEAEKWGQIVQTNAANIQQVVDNLTDIQNAAENAQAAAASAAAAQQAAQEALGFRTFFSAVRPDKNGNLDPSRPMVVGPAASVEIESAGDRIQSVTALGFTTQAGSGDPSPSNVRQLTNGGIRLKKYAVTGKEPGWQKNDGTDNNGNYLYFLAGFGAAVGSECICNRLKYYSTTFDTTPSVGISPAGSLYMNIGSAGDSLASFKKALNDAYSSGKPYIVWYQPADESQATGLYAPIILTSSEYRATCLELTAPLCEGDSVVSWAKSGCDKMVVLKGDPSEDWRAISNANYARFNAAGIPTAMNAQVWCNKLSYASGSNYVVVGDGNNRPSVFLDKTKYTSVEDWKNELANAYSNGDPYILFYQSTNYIPAADIPVSLETHQRAVLVLDGTENVALASTGYIRIAIPAGAPKPKGGASSTNVCSAAKFEYNVNGAGFYMDAANNLIVFGAAYVQSAGWGSAEDCKAYLAAGAPVTIVYQLATPITYAHPAVVLEAATGEQLTYTVTGQSGGTVSVALKPFQDGGHAKTADNAANAQNATKFDGHAWSEVSGQAPVQSVNGETGAVTLAATDVGAQPTMTIEPLSITASGSGFAVNEGSFAVKYGALRIVFASITVNSVGSEGWVKVADVSGAAAVKTVHRVLASSGGTADSIAVYVNPNSIEMYLSNKDVGKIIYVDAVSYYV